MPALDNELIGTNGDGPETVLRARRLAESRGTFVAGDFARATGPSPVKHTFSAGMLSAPEFPHDRFKCLNTAVCAVSG